MVIDVKEIEATGEMTSYARNKLRKLNMTIRSLALCMFEKEWTVKVNGKTIRASIKDDKDNEETPVCKKRNHSEPLDGPAAKR